MITIECIILQKITATTKKISTFYAAHFVHFLDLIRTFLAKIRPKWPKSIGGGAQKGIICAIVDKIFAH